MVDSPREIIGAVLKYMGASYNTLDITSQVAGGKTALLEKLMLLTKQVNLNLKVDSFVFPTMRQSNIDINKKNIACNISKLMHGLLILQPRLQL